MLKNKIQEDLKTAMLSQDEKKLSTIRMLKSALQYFEIEKGGAGYEASDEDVISVVEREIKKRRESIEMFEKGQRMELAEKEKQELEILQTYLPEQLTENEIKELVEDAILKVDASEIRDMGKVMSILSPQIKGKADGGFVSSIVKEKLNK